MASRAGYEHTVQSANQVVDKVVREVEINFTDFKINEIVKGGSLGHGTAVPGDFDIDLVIYSSDIFGFEMLNDAFQCKHKEQMKKLAHFLKGKFGMDIDLHLSPYFKDQNEFYGLLMCVRSGYHWKLSVCASKWQVEFFRKQPNEVKEYIKKAKAWRNKMWSKHDPEKGQGRPSSYLMSLLVVAAYRRRGHKTVTQALKDLVQNSHCQLDIYWADGPGDFYKRRDFAQLLPSRPRIIDPANPTNNVWETGLAYHKGGDNSLLLRQYIQTIDLE